MKNFNHLLWGLVLSVVVASCVTQKKKDDVSFMAKVYHNTTARYNGYFNANELIKETILRMDEQYQDDYDGLLSMYPYVETKNANAVAPDMDKAIEKVTVVVSLHPQSHWVDDCYLLAGKAQYLKQDYEAAEKTLRYMVNEFNPALKSDGYKLRASSAKVEAQKAKNSSRASSRQKAKERAKANKQKRKELKKKSKVRKKYSEAVRKARKKGKTPPEKPAILRTGEEGYEGKTAEEIRADLEREAREKAEANESDNYFLKHRPCYQEGVLWLARTLIERDNYEGALRYLEELDGEPKTFNDIQAEIPAIRAYMYVKREEYELAVNPLIEAITLATKKEVKARYSFILGQLYQKMDRNSEAVIAFEDVLKYTNNYDMEFSSKLNIATNGWSSGTGSSEQAKSAINKLLKDERNVDYKDRLYFALANIAFDNNDREEGIKNLRLSIQSSVQNKKQKAEAYLMLAELFIEEEDYLNASYYYDSTLTVLPKEDERYAEVKTLSENLSEIAQNIETIALQDSLLRLAGLSEEELKEVANAIAVKRAQERIESLQNNATNKQAVNTNRTTLNRNPLQQNESTFFAYDDKAVKRGVRDFQRIWGDRKLEDNWRRSEQVSEFKEIKAAEEVDLANVNLSEDEIKDILKDVPLTDQAKLSSQLKIQEALFNLGKLYRDKLQNADKAIESLETLVTRYPTTSFLLDSWYYLHLSYLEKGDNAKAKEYADKIIAKYPTSTYAKVIQDPNYLQQLQDEKMQLDIYYDQAYETFEQGEYEKAH
ncbi:MAG: tetratricopeptide repeat protein, partial [Bacteroidota bacterium]